MTALENVALPLLYSENENDLGAADDAPGARSASADRSRHRPNELSGGQQQRVAIARVDGQPTRRSSWRTSRPATSTPASDDGDPGRAARAQRAGHDGDRRDPRRGDRRRSADRVIRIRDGVHPLGRADRPIGRRHAAGRQPCRRLPNRQPARASAVFEHFRQGLRALAANKVRTALSMLGILIGVAAVVAMLALGQGARGGDREAALLPGIQPAHARRPGRSGRRGGPGRRAPSRG